MNTETKELAVPGVDVAAKLNDAIQLVLGQQGMVGFQKAYLMAEGIRQLKTMLTDEYMQPIMALQGSRLGFRTDKDKEAGYPMNVVRDCVIEGVLMGLQPYGNQINIIGGNMYATKEGIGYWLNNCKGLKHEIVCGLPRLNADGKSAAVDATIKWTINGETNERIIPIPIRVNAMMGVDAIMGKATRKARAWLMSTVSGIEVVDNDVEDQDARVVSTTIKKTQEEKESERLTQLINEAETVEQLNKYRDSLKPEHNNLFNERMGELVKKNGKKS